MILTTLPLDGFRIGTGPGDIASGAAVAFIPQSACNLTTATLLLRGYDGFNGQQISLQLCDNSQTNEPLSGTDFICPPPNDGSLATFTFNLQPPAVLKLGITYWLFIYGRLNDTNFSHEIKLNWVMGGVPSGDIIYQKSLQFTQSGFFPSSICPAFAINAA